MVVDLERNGGWGAGVGRRAEGLSLVMSAWGTRATAESSWPEISHSQDLPALSPGPSIWLPTLVSTSPRPSLLYTVLPTLLRWPLKAKA